VTAAEQFRSAIEQAGLFPPAKIHDDGKLHRFASNGDRDDDAGWYTLFGDGVPAGAFGCWRSNIKQTWSAKPDQQMSAQERAEHRLRLETVQRERETELRRRHKEAAERAAALWEEACLAPADHPYLVRKDVRSYGLRQSIIGDLLLPMRDETGRLTSLQFIKQDGAKQFLPGGQVQGASYQLGEQGPTLLIAEGYATAASLHAATALPVVIAFNAGNLLSVAQSIRRQHPLATILICGDHDLSGAGQTKAKDAAEAINGRLVIPSQAGLDWNDVHVRDGLEVVKTKIQAALEEKLTMMSAMKSAHPITMSVMSVQASGEWPEIQPIKAELLPVDLLPFKLIPPAFRDWVKDVAERMQCPIDFVAAPMLVMAGAVIGAGCGMRPKKHDDWTVVPNLWGGVIGRPSMLKTPAISEALKPLETLEAEAKQAYDGATKDHKAELEAYDAQKEALKADMRSVAKRKGSTNGHALPSMDSLKYDFAHIEEPKPPVWRRYKTNDATIEKMAALQAENPRGLLLFRDELVGLLATWDKEDHQSDRAFYLEGFNGLHSYTADRIGRGHVYSPHNCVSVFGGIQPTKLSTYLYAAMRGQNNDGLVQRLQVLVYPDEPPDWTLVDTPINGEARELAYRAVRQLAAMDFRQYGAYGDESEQIPYYRFDDAGQEVFYQWLSELEQKLRTTDEEPVVLEHLGKYRSLMPSLALIFHLLDLVTEGPNAPHRVTKDNAELAAGWCEYLEQHARRVYGLVTNAACQGAARLAEKLQGGALQDGFTVRDVYIKGWSLLSDRQPAANACYQLTTWGWLREQDIPSAPGHKGKTVYLINPQVKTHG